MSTAGRRRAGRSPNVEDETLSQIAKEAEARLAQKRAARIEAREIRMRELEKQQREEQDSDDRNVKNSISITKGSNLGSVPSYYNHSDQSLSYRSGSFESLNSDATPDGLKEALKEMEEKYKKAMVQTAQLDNEKSQLHYQSQHLFDLMEEQEEDFYRLKKKYKEKCQELEKQKRGFDALRKKCNDLQDALDERNELIETYRAKEAKSEHYERVIFDLKETVMWKDKKLEALVRQIDFYKKNENSVRHSYEQGLVLVGSGGEQVGHGDGKDSSTIISHLELKLAQLAEENQELCNQVARTNKQLEEARRTNVENHFDPDSSMAVNEMQLLEIQREANKQVNEYKFKLQKSEQDIAAFHGSISRLESQLLRYKQSTEGYEKNEDEMRAEKRKLMRDLRSALDRIEEVEMTNSHLEKRLERMRASRTALAGPS